MSRTRAAARDSTEPIAKSQGRGPPLSSLLIVGIVHPAAREPIRQLPSRGISFQFLARHTLKRLGEGLVLKLDRLPRSSLGSVGDFSGGLDIPANGIPYLRFSNNLSPSPPVWIIWDGLFELVLVRI